MRIPRRSQPKIRIVIDARAQGPITASLAGVPWASEFALPADRAKIARILSLSRVKTQKFLLHPTTQVTGATQGNALVVFDDFPTAEEVHGKVGGGVFHVRARTAPQGILKTYKIDGPRREDAKGREKSKDTLRAKKEEFKAKVLETAFQWIQNDPDLMLEVGLLVLSKELGTRMPKWPSWEERLIREAVESDEELNDQVAKQLLEQKFGNRADAELKRMRRTIRFMQELQALCGQSDEGGQSESAAAAKAFVENGGLGQVLEGLRQARIGDGQTAASVPSVVTEQPEADDVDGPTTDAPETAPGPLSIGVPPTSPLRDDEPQTGPRGPRIVVSAESLVLREGDWLLDGPLV